MEGRERMRESGWWIERKKKQRREECTAKEEKQKGKTRIKIG